MDLPIPSGLKREWAALRDAPAISGALGKGAGLGSVGKPFRRSGLFAASCRLRHARAQAGSRSRTILDFRISRRKRNGRSISSCRAGRRRSTCLITSRTLPAQLRQRHARLGSRQSAVDRHDCRPGAFSHCSGALAFQAIWARPEPGSAICFLTPRAWWTISPFIKSTNTDAINHEPAIMLMNTGNMNAGKPCLGSGWRMGLAA